MKRLVTFALATSALLSADTIVLKNGQHLNGTYLGGDARTIKFDSADRVATYQVSEVESVRFGSGSETSPTPNAAAAMPATAPAQRTVQIYANTPITVRLIDPIRSDEASAGSVYRASVDTPVYSGGHIVIPAYSSAVVQLLDKTNSGHLTGRTSLALALTKIEIAGKSYDVQTTDTVQASRGRGASSAKLAGGTAAAGAVIGALAGGGRGAARQLERGPVQRSVRLCRSCVLDRE